MKKFLIILVTGILYCNISYSSDSINISDLVVNAEWSTVNKKHVNLKYNYKAISHKNLPGVTTCVALYDKNNKQIFKGMGMDATSMKKDESKVFEYSYTISKDEWNKAHTIKIFLSAWGGCRAIDSKIFEEAKDHRSDILEFAKNELMDESEENSISESTTSSKPKVSKTLGLCNFSVDEINKLGFSFQKFPSSRNPTDTGTMIICGSLPGTSQRMIIFVNPVRIYVKDVLERGYCIYLKQGRIDKVNNQQECQH